MSGSSSTVDCDWVTGNTLHIFDWAGNQARTIGNFETVNFSFSTGAKANAAAGTTLLSLTDAADFSNTTEFTSSGINPGAALNPSGINTRIAINVLGGDDFIAPGTRFTVIDNVANAEYYADATIYGQHGTMVEYQFDSELNGGQLSATYRSVGVNPYAKVLTQSYLAGTAMLNRGGDLVVSDGIAGLDNSLANHQAGWSGLAVFSGFSAGYDEIKTGSHLDVDSVRFLAGLGVKNVSAAGTLLLGGFFETGYGDYDSSAGLADRAPVEGEGDSQYLGGGVLGRYRLANGIYADASARIGRIKNNLSSSNLTDPFGNAVGYDVSDTYYGAHFGMGWLYELAGRSTLDLSARYFWTRTGSHTISANNDPVTLDSVNSHRLRAAARYSRAVSEYASPYLGLAYEYEFDGKSTGATRNTFRLPDSSLKGGTGLAELGMTCRVGRASVDFGMQGSLGRRQGLA
ncbi:MAG: autotransporter outer membrane beta-barrel domain-containing protein, partial [Planctomycetes bacterium]|nr:autotransporter outer membrane beta-barrel domain-containing protein [Planctomycetota bacterium]